MGIDKLEKILIVLAKKGINSDWLLTGRGSIEEKESAPLILEEPILTYASRGIPYIRNAIAWCGAGGSFDGSEYVSGWIDLPAYRTCDGAISVEGDSMTPHLEPGDIVLVSAIQDLDSFLPGRMHLVVTREMAQVKYLYPGRDPGTLRLLSAQPRYSELVLHVADVLSIYQVRGRINTV